MTIECVLDRHIEITPDIADGKPRLSGKIKFYMDEHVPTAVTTGLRLRGVDVLTAQESDLLAASDETHLAWASNKGRVLFTQDADFLRLHAAGVPHAGIPMLINRLGLEWSFGA